MQHKHRKFLVLLLIDRRTVARALPLWTEAQRNDVAPPNPSRNTFLQFYQKLRKRFHPALGAQTVDCLAIARNPFAQAMSQSRLTVFGVACVVGTSIIFYEPLSLNFKSLVNRRESLASKLSLL